HFIAKSVHRKIEFTYAESVADALPLLAERGRFDVILLDIIKVIPLGREKETIKKIQEAHPYLPVIMLSFQDDPGRILDFLDYGACSFIPKRYLPSGQPEGAQ